MYIKVTVPQPGCPSGRVLHVSHIQDNGTVIGMDARNDDDWTSYYIAKSDYEFIEEG